MGMADRNGVLTGWALLMTGALSAFAPASAQGAPGRDRMLVTTEWLRTHAADANLVLLHVGDQAGYSQEHIAGARLVPMDGLSTGMAGADALTLEMLPADELKKQLEALGITDKSRIVVYHGASMFPAATRVIFTLQNAGFSDRVALLDGGLPEWKRASYPVVADATVARPGKLPPLKLQNKVVDAAYVHQHLSAPGYKVIDARASMFYDGLQGGGGSGETHAKGHIPGALSVPFTAVTGADLKLRSADDLAVLFRTAGVASGDKLMVYCHVGWQGTAVVFAARSLGYDAVLYDGSFQDWSRRNLPVERPGAPG
ncbi:MAG: sulfurtransferase [Alphaproteobacteria bacterium]|nr:MAG: sulfurtransferase [Alphaproteobacteria bacterium]